MRRWRLDVDVAKRHRGLCRRQFWLGRNRAEVLQKLLPGCRSLAPPPSPIWACAWETVAGIPGAADAGRISSASSATRSMCRPRWARRCGDKLDGGGNGLPASAPFGRRSNSVCCAWEKGHIIVGQDTDGPDASLRGRHMAWAISKKQGLTSWAADRSISRTARGLTRASLVGFTLDDPQTHPLPEECHLVVRGAGEFWAASPLAVISPSVRVRVVGLAYVAPDQAEPGKSFDIKVDGGRLIQARGGADVRSSTPENKRQEM